MSGFKGHRRTSREAFDSDESVSDSLAPRKSPHRESRHKISRKGSGNDPRYPRASSSTIPISHGSQGSDAPLHRDNTLIPQQFPHRKRHAEDTEQLHEQSRDSASAPFRSTSFGSPSDQDAPLEPFYNQPRLSEAGTPNYLEKYVAIELGDYNECSQFLTSHERHLNFSWNYLLQKAVQALSVGNSDYAARCVQQSLILHKWRNSSGSERQKLIKQLSQPTSRAGDFLAKDFSIVLDAVKRSADESPGSHRTREHPERQPSGSTRRDQVDLGHHTRETSSISAPEVPDDYTVNPVNQSRHSYSEVIGAVTPNNKHSQTNPATAAPEEVTRQARVLQTSISGRHRHDEQSSPVRDAPQSSFTSSRGPNPQSLRAGHVAGGYQTYEPTTRRSPSISGEQTYGRPALDSRYSVREDNFFRFGRVFSVLWHESAPGRETSSSLIRRMVVVKESTNFCWCIAINTYGGQGLKKMGMTRQEVAAHATIHMTDQQPRIIPEEQWMTKEPLEVEPSTWDQELAPFSRLNFAKVYTVESFHKVAEVGRVAQKSLQRFRQYWKEQTEKD